MTLYLPDVTPEDMATMHRLYPGITDEEAEAAAYNFARYAASVLRIYDYIRSDPERYREFKETLAQLREVRDEESRWALIHSKIRSTKRLR